MDLEIKKNLRRRTEEIDYWRKRAGWYDDDISMTEYNNGVYDTYYQIDDDVPRSKSGTSVVAEDSEGFNTTGLKIGAVVVAVAVSILVYRAIAGRRISSKERSSSDKKGTTDTKSRSRSKSASRSRSSRSRSRSRRPGASVAGGATSSNYEIMDEKSEARSRKSSRSRSRSRKAGSSRSRSRARVPSTPVLLPTVKQVEDKILV
jgi:hypothetical protein